MKTSPRLLTLMVFVMSWPVLAQGHVKVHKDKVAISAPNSAGMVLVRGETGAVTSSSPVQLKIENRSADRQVSVDLAVDGSFEALILADSGDEIRVTARNEEKKRSYGTFTVPTPPIAAPPDAGSPARSGADHPDDGADAAPTPDAAPTLGATESLQRLTVLVVVTDPVTNEVLAVRQVSGRLRSKADDLAGPAERIVDRLLDALARELHLGFARPAARASAWERLLRRPAAEAPTPASTPTPTPVPLPSGRPDAAHESRPQNGAAPSSTQGADPTQPDPAVVVEQTPRQP